MATILDTLYPPQSALSSSTLQGVTARIVGYEQAQYPTVDMRPGSVHGDLSIAPDSWRLAAAETGINGILGDLNLQNVINGTIYSCDFVDAYLNNMGITAQVNAVSSGTVRLIFDRPTLDTYFTTSPTLTINRGIQFLFGQANIFNVVTSSDADSIQLYPVGSAVSGVGVYALAVLDQATYAVDVAVTGSMPDTVSAGDTASLSATVPGLTQAMALYDFVPGNPATTLAQRAQLAVSTFYAASLNTRAGTSGFVFRQFPAVSACSPVLTGDLEMIRDTTNVLGVSDGRLDVYARSSTGILQDTIQVDLPYVIDNGETRFIGPVSFPNIPMLVDDISALNAPSVQIWNPALTPSPTPRLMSQTTDVTKGVLGGITRSAYEAFCLAVDMPKDTYGNPLIPVQSANGNQYATFVITYRFDPSTRPLTEVVCDSSNKPVGVDVLARAPVPLVMTNLTLNYTRVPGTSVNTGGAATEILANVNAWMYPKVFSIGSLADSMNFYGASSFKGFAATAFVYQSPATYYLPSNVAFPTTNAQLDTLFNPSSPIAIAVPVDAISDFDINPMNLTNPLIGLQMLNPVVTLASAMVPATRDASRFNAYGPRNLAWILDPTNLVFQEVRS